MRGALSARRDRNFYVGFQRPAGWTSEREVIYVLNFRLLFSPESVNRFFIKKKEASSPSEGRLQINLTMKSVVWRFYP